MQVMPLPSAINLAYSGKKGGYWFQERINHTRSNFHYTMRTGIEKRDIKTTWVSSWSGHHSEREIWWPVGYTTCPGLPVQPVQQQQKLGSNSMSRNQHYIAPSCIYFSVGEL